LVSWCSLGATIDILANLCVLPLLGGPPLKKRV
jgi:hypothetical protein